MDTGKVILIAALLAAVVLGAVLLNSGDPVGAALVQAQIGIDTAPAQVSPLGGLWSFAAKALVILCCLVALGAVVFFAWQQFQKRRHAGSGWAPGPNGQWKRAGLPKAPSMMDLLTLQAYRQILRDQQQREEIPLFEESKKVRL